MKCPYCGKSIQNESLFCMYCGKSIDKSISNNTFSSLPPTAISKLGIWFESGMEETGRKKGKTWLIEFSNRNYWPKMLSRKITFFFQLMDDSHETTACDGQAIFQMIWIQSYYLANSSEMENGSINNEYEVITSDFSRTKNNELCCKITCQEPQIIHPDYLVEGKAQLWFIPKGANKKLYITDTFSLSPTG